MFDQKGGAGKKTTRRNRYELGRFAQHDQGLLPLGAYLKKKPSSGSDDGPGYSPFVMPSSEPQRADKDGSNVNNKYECQSKTDDWRKRDIMKHTSTKSGEK
jgi:hypothetical protein